MIVEPGRLKMLVRAIAATRGDEIGCDECFEKLDEFVDLTLAGMTAAEAMPLVHDHLERCSNCREEFLALLSALQGSGEASVVHRIGGAGKPPGPCSVGEVAAPAKR
jgi:hypothetical protein